LPTPLQKTKKKKKKKGKGGKGKKAPHLLPPNKTKKMPYAAETPRLYLERLSEKHLLDFHELWNNDEAVLWSYVPFPCPDLLIPALELIALQE
jgi:hypothetical protein